MGTASVVSTVASNAVDRGLKPWSGETKRDKISMCYVSAKYFILGYKTKHWLSAKQNNVPEWSGLSTQGLLFQLAGTIQIQLSVLVWYKAGSIIIWQNVTGSRHDIHVAEQMLFWLLATTTTLYLVNITCIYCSNSTPFSIVPWLNGVTSLINVSHL